MHKFHPSDSRANDDEVLRDHRWWVGLASRENPIAINDRPLGDPRCRARCHQDRIGDKESFNLFSLSPHRHLMFTNETPRASENGDALTAELTFGGARKSLGDHRHPRAQHLKVGVFVVQLHPQRDGAPRERANPAGGDHRL